MSPYNNTKSERGDRAKDGSYHRRHSMQSNQQAVSRYKTPSKKKRSIFHRSRLVAGPDFGGDIDRGDAGEPEYNQVGSRRSGKEASGDLDGSAVDSASTTTKEAAEAAIRRSGGSETDEYDYRAFCGHRPLRRSKIAAFEGGEAASRQFFRQKEAELEAAGHVEVEKQEPWSNYKKASVGHKRKHSGLFTRGGIGLLARQSGSRRQKPVEVDDGTILIQLPGLSCEETRELVSGTERKKILSGMSEQASKKDENWMNRHGKGWNRNTQQRMSAMRSAMKPVSEYDLVQQRLSKSRLPQVFQETGGFLTQLSMRELEYWEMMNEQFESGIEAERRKIGGASNKRSLEDDEEEAGKAKTERVPQRSYGSGGEYMEEDEMMDDARQVSGSSGEASEEERFDFIDAPFDALYGSEVDSQLAAAVSEDIKRHVKEDLEEL